MKYEDILSPLNKQAVAEQALLKFLRENGVFDPPKENESFYRVEQGIRIDELLRATAKFALEHFEGDPRPVLRILAENTAEIIRRFL